MAMRETIRVDDDIDGTPGAVRVEFAIDGAWYEIDLAPHNANQLREVFAQYIPHARKSTVVVPLPTDPRKRPWGERTRELNQRRNRLNEIREWARRNHLPVSDAGRVPKTVEHAWETHHSRGHHPAPGHATAATQTVESAPPAVFFSEAS